MLSNPVYKKRVSMFNNITTLFLCTQGTEDMLIVLFVSCKQIYFFKSNQEENEMTVAVNNTNKQGRNLLVGGEQMSLEFRVPEKYWLRSKHISSDTYIAMFSERVLRTGKMDTDFAYYEDFDGNPLTIFDLPMLYKAIGKEDAVLTEKFFESSDDVFNLCVHAGYDASFKTSGDVVLELTKDNSVLGVEELPTMFKWLIDHEDICW